MEGSIEIHNSKCVLLVWLLRWLDPLRDALLSRFISNEATFGGVVYFVDTGAQCECRFERPNYRDSCAD